MCIKSLRRYFGIPVRDQSGKPAQATPYYGVVSKFLLQNTIERQGRTGHIPSPQFQFANSADKMRIEEAVMMRGWLMRICLVVSKLYVSKHFL